MTPPPQPALARTVLAGFAIPSILALGPTAHAYEWQVRRAHVADQKPEWSEAGYLPAWTVTPNDANDGFRINGDREGKFRGTMLVGTKIDIPSPLPASLKIRLRFQTFCATNDPPRGGTPGVALFDPATWSLFEDTTSPTIKFDVRSEKHAPLFYQRLGKWGEDVTEWRDWQSNELRRKLREHAGQELVLAFVWSAMHFHVEEWAAVEGIEIVTKGEDDVLREFYESFDLSRPDLKAVAKAVEAADWAAAEASLATHFRTRTAPPPPKLSSGGNVGRADEICEHVFRFVGCPPHNVGPDIKWNEDPFNYDQWAIALNRHTHWLTLGTTYKMTGDEKYAREFVAQLRSWIDAMPVYIGPRWIQGPFGEAGRAPLSLDAGIRMGQTWFRAMYYFLKSPNFGDADLVAMLRSFRDHALYLMDPAHFKSGSNWGAMEANGLLHIGCMLPEFRNADTWRETAIERLHGELDNQVYPDGAQVELAPGYHGVTLGNMLGALEVAHRCEVALPEDFEAKLERMFDCYARASDPARRCPALNDSGAGNIQGWMARGLEFFPQRDDFRFLQTDGKEGSPPDYTSTRFPYAGWHVMRSGWGRDACYLLMDAGPFGTGHQHEDKLTVNVHAFGRPLIVDAGNYAYDTSEWRKYILSTRSHNTIRVDGLDQRHRSVRDSYRADEPVATDWSTSDALDFASATYTLGYGREENVPVTHQRSVVFLKPRMWLIVDELIPEDDAEHSYEGLFHFDAPDAIADADTGVVVTEHPSGANVALVPVRFDGWTVDIVQGQQEPVVQGWLPTGKHNVLRPIPTAAYHRTATDDAMLALLVAPLREGEAPPKLSPLPLDGDAAPGSFAVEIASPDGVRHTVLWNAAPGTELQAGELATTSRVAVRSSADNAVAEAP